MNMKKDWHDRQGALLSRLGYGGVGQWFLVKTDVEYFLVKYAYTFFDAPLRLAVQDGMKKVGLVLLLLVDEWLSTSIACPGQKRSRRQCHGVGLKSHAMHSYARSLCRAD